VLAAAVDGLLRRALSPARVASRLPIVGCVPGRGSVRLVQPSAAA